MARLSTKTWTSAILPASDLNTYVRDQMVEIDSWSMILQAARTTTKAEDSTTSASFVDTSLSLTFTPEDAASVIYLFVMHGGIDASAAGGTFSLRLRKDVTLLEEFFTTEDIVGLGYASYIGVDSTHATSAVTYHTEWRRDSGSTTGYLQRDSEVTSSMLIVEVI